MGLYPLSGIFLPPALAPRYKTSSVRAPAECTLLQLSFDLFPHPLNHSTRTHAKKEKETEREREIQRERETDRHRQRQRERETDRDRDRDRQTDGQRQRDREHIAHKHSSLNHGDLDFLISRHPLQVGGIESAEEVSHRHVHVPVCHDPLP